MDMLVPAFMHRKYKEALDAFDLLVWDTREIVRLGRSNTRNKKGRRRTLWITNGCEFSLTKRHCVALMIFC